MVTTDSGDRRAMSEETSLTVELVTNEHEPTSCAFADGIHTIPPHIVQDIGGLSALENIREGLQDVSIREFMEGYQSVMVSRKLNEIQTKVIQNHFAPRFF